MMNWTFALVFLVALTAGVHVTGAQVSSAASMVAWQATNGIVNGGEELWRRVRTRQICVPNKCW